LGTFLGGKASFSPGVILLLLKPRGWRRLGAQHGLSIVVGSLALHSPSRVRSGALGCWAGWAHSPDGSALQDQLPAAPRGPRHRPERSSASPRKVLGIAHRGAPPVPSIARLPQPATKPSNCSTFLST